MKTALLVSLSLLCLTALSAPVEFDTDAVHVVVIRPMDSWSGDASNAEARLEALIEKKTYYGFSVDDQNTGKRTHVQGGAAAFGSVSKHPLAQASRELLLKEGFSPSQDTKIGFDIEFPVAIDPEQWAAFTAIQSDNFKNAVVAQGDPSTLQSRTRSRKFLGGLFALATMAVGVDKLGAATGMNATLGSGISNDAYRIAVEAGRAISPVRLPEMDLSKYKSIDVRRVTDYVRPSGQLIFAYKGDKTPEAELDALLKSITVLAGAGANPESVEKSRAEDYSARMAIWNACVAESRPECKSQ